jgi:hypothetical protein
VPRIWGNAMGAGSHVTSYHEIWQSLRGLPELCVERIVVMYRATHMWQHHNGNIEHFGMLGEFVQ